jgi:hypothetical protein
MMIAGCAPGSIFYTPTEAERAQAMMAPEQRFERRWAGRPADDVLLQYGKPHDLIPLSSGNQVYSYRYENQVTSSRSFATGYAAGSRSHSQGVECERRFEIDRATSKVLRAAIRGNACDYDD